MKKILVLCHSASIGGAELALASLIEYTHEIYEWHLVFADTKKAPNTLTARAKKVEYIDLPWWCYEAHDNPKVIHKKSLLKSMKKLESLSQNADVLLTNTITIPWLGFIAQKINKPHIWYVHEFGDIDHNLKFISGYQESLEIISKNSSRILTISDAVKQHIAQTIPESRIDIIHQSIDFTQIPFGPPNLNETSLVKLAVLGAMKPSKGQKIVIDAVKKINSISGKSFTLDVVGPNANEAYVGNLEKIVKGDNRISVQSRYFELAHELNNHDVLIMASENEALGRVTLEGLAAGKTVVGYACKATEDLLKDGRGVLYSPNSPDALAKVLADLVDLSKNINYKSNALFAKKTHGPERQSLDFEICINNSKDTSVESNETYSNYLDSLAEKSLYIGTMKSIKTNAKNEIAKKTPKKIKTAARKLRFLK